MVLDILESWSQDVSRLVFQSLGLAHLNLGCFLVIKLAFLVNEDEHFVGHGRLNS